MIFRNSDDKLKYINKYLAKLMNIAEKSVRDSRYNLALASLATYCNIQYGINQKYTDNRAEELVLEITRKLVYLPSDYNGKSNTVLFYDGFGLDLRGWAASFARALSEQNYNVVYVAPLSSFGKIPHIVSEIAKGKGTIEYVDMKESYESHLGALNRIFNSYQPQTAFFYTTPHDVAGAAVFNAYKDRVNRIQIDLTEHAFWVGTNAFDYITESRDIGASNAVYQRRIDKERIIRIDGCLYINSDIEDAPLPFDIEKEKYIFSGGSLYKTLGDDNLFFYKMVDSILAAHEDIRFLYAGGGDDSELNKIILKYPKRAFHINERKDFYRLFENCIFFLNTYPMFGGLMMRYSANAGKIPLTLRHGSDNEGILIDQKNREIEYDTFNELMDEAHRLIIDDEYRRTKEKKLEGSVITQAEFAEMIKNIISNKEKCDSFDMIEEIDTSIFRKEYLERLDPEEVLLSSIPLRINKPLLLVFPTLFFKRIIRRIET